MVTLTDSNGESIPILSAEVSHNEGDQLWQASVQLTDLVGYKKLPEGSNVTLTFNLNNSTSRTWLLMVDTRSTQGTGATAPTYSAQLLSRTALLASPKAQLMDKSYANDIMASAAVQEVFADTQLTWSMVDWLLPKASLIYTATTPMDVAVAIVTAAGGVCETTYDGVIVARPKYPVVTYNWSTAIVDFTLDDAVAVLSQSVTRGSDRLWNQITIRSPPVTDTSTSSVLVEVDSELSPSTNSGSTVYYRIYKTANVTTETPRLSIGTLVSAISRSSIQTEAIVFDNTNTANLSKYCTSGFSWQWTGNELGSLTVGTDLKTVTAASSGVAVAVVTYTSAYSGFGVNYPALEDGSGEYKAIVHVDATSPASPQSDEVTYKRSIGGWLAPDLQEPLLINSASKLARAQKELDDGERYKSLSLDVVPLLTTAICGNLVQYNNLLENSVERGQIVAISHKVTISPPSAVTSLTLKVRE